MRFTFFIAFVCCHLLLLRAQQVPVIVKDYKQCTVGLQDRKGNWITPAVYTDIQPFVNRQAIALRGGYYGVLDASGKERIPAAYNKISFLGGIYESSFGTGFFTRYDLYLCNSNDRSVIIDTTGKIVLDVAMQLNRFYTDNTATASDAAGRWYIVWLNGKIVPLPATIKSEPTRILPGLYRFSEVNTWSVGAIDTNAHVVLPPQYERVLGYSEPFRVVRADKKQTSFVFTPDGKRIAECPANRFRFEENPFSYTGLLAYKGASGFGMVNWKGDTILPFVYDSEPSLIHPHVFIVQKDGKFSVVSDSSFNHPFMTYDALVPVPQYNYWQIPPNHYYARSEGGWNLINAKGETYFTEPQDTFIQTGDQILFVKNGELTSVRFEWRAAEIGLNEKMYNVWTEKLHVATRRYLEEDFSSDTVLQDNYMWYEAYEAMLDADSVKPYKLNRKKPPVNPYPYLLSINGGLFPVMTRLDTVDSGIEGCTVYVNRESSYNRLEFQHIAGMSATDSNGAFHFYTVSRSLGADVLALSDQKNSALVSSTGKVIVWPGLYEWFSDTRSASGIIIAYNHQHNAVLIDRNGNTVLDTRTNLCRAGSDGFVWLGDSVSDANGRVSCPLVWHLYNYNTRQYAIDTTLQITKIFPVNGELQKIQTRQGTGLINTNDFRIVAPPAYAELFSIDQSNRFFAVRTCMHFGLISSTGTLLLDTLYDGFTKMAGPTKLTNTPSQALRPNDVFLFFNHTDSMALLYGNGTINRIDSTEHEVLLHLMQTAYNLQQLPGTQCVDCHTLLNFDIGVHISKWQTEFIYHHVFDSCRGMYPEIHGYQSEQNNCSCRDYFRFAPFPYNNEGLRSVTVYHANDSVLAFDSHSVGNGFSSYFIYHNIVLSANGPKELTLDSLFRDRIWRAVISDSVLAYLKAHPGINADCSHPEKYPDVLQNRFLLDQKGLVLYPDWNWQTDGIPLVSRPEITIPWSVLSPHLRADIKLKLQLP